MTFGVLLSPENKFLGRFKSYFFSLLFFCVPSMSPPILPPQCLLSALLSLLLRALLGYSIYAARCRQGHRGFSLIGTEVGIFDP